MDNEAIWYEYSPYIYTIAGLAAISTYGSYLAIISGVILLVASATILRMRWTYRKTKVQRERDERAKRVMKRIRQRNKSVENF